MSLKHYLLCGFGAAIICLQACGGTALDPTTPDGSVMVNVEALKNNDVSAYVDNLLTSKQKSELSQKWDAERSSKKPSDMEKQQFEQQMKSMTSGEMIDQMMPMVEQQLAQYNNEQIAGMVGMFGGMLLNSPDLDEKQKAQLQTFIGSLSEWVKSADITNPEKVRSLLKSVQSTAQKLNIKTLDEVQAMNFDQVLDKGDVVFAGVKDALNVYNISIDKVLNSVSVDSVENNGEFSNITISFEIFGAKQTATTTMKKIDGKWIEAQMADKITESFASMGASGN